MSKESTILVTGGSGFIGSALIRYLIKNTKNNIVNIDKLTYAGNKESLESIANNSRYFFEEVDICNKDQIDRVFNTYKPNIIMHLAAESHVDNSILDPSIFIKTNIIGTYNLLEASKEYIKKIDLQSQESFRFHHISTDEVFGDLEKGKLFTEKTPYNPSSPYSSSKASSDHLVRAWNRTYNLPTIITNCSNNYGPFQFPEKLIPLVILNALNNKPIPIYGNGTQIRDWLYVEDHAVALYEVVKNGIIGQTYNIGGHNEKQNIEVVEIICNLLDKYSPRKDNASHTKNITFVADRSGHDTRYAIDASKIENELGWTPNESFETGIEKTVSWYIDNMDWCNIMHMKSLKLEDNSG